MKELIVIDSETLKKAYNDLSLDVTKFETYREEVEISLIHAKQHYKKAKLEHN